MIVSSIDCIEKLWYSMNVGLDSVLGNDPIVIFLILLWSIFWKGIALWRSANLKQRNWFLVILVVSSLGIIEIMYLFWFAKEKLTFKEIKSWISRKTK